MSKVIQISLSIILIVISVYSLMTNDDQLLPFIFLLLSVLFLLVGINEIKENRKFLGWMLISATICHCIVVVTKYFIHD